MGVDPAFIGMLRHDYRHARLTPRIQVVPPVEFLLAQPPDGLPVLADGGARLPVFLHCGERAAGQSAVLEWQRLGARLGLAFEVAATGCCGMAGSYGHEAAHLADSRALFELSWAGAIAGEDRVLASGFSCRCQTGRFAGVAAVHPFRAIAEAFARQS